MPKSKPKILLWDIETSHNIVLSYTLYEKRGLSIPHKNIRRERQILCASWKWLGKSGVESARVESGDEYCGDDKEVVMQIHDALSSADAVVHHHGDYFDLRYFNARSLRHKLRPIPPIVQIDTKKIASSRFLFNSNRLDYLGQFLQLGNKIKTDNDLWVDCLFGDERALQRMVQYNRQDVRLLERVFKELRPHVPTKINHQLFGNPDACPSCGSLKTQKRGFDYTSKCKYQRHQCTSCGNWFRGKRVSS